MIKNRTEAGKLLAQKIHEENSIVLSIPRGGVVVGAQIAKKLGCHLDVAISKKITPPNSPEYAIGAIACDGSTFQTKYWEKFSKMEGFEDEIKKKHEEVKRRVEEYRGSSNYDFGDKTVILVDDGIATGATVFAILNWLSKIHVKKIILAVPVMPVSTFELMKNLVDKIISLEIPMDFSSVGQFYEEFNQVSDEEVLEILESSI